MKMFCKHDWLWPRKRKRKVPAGFDCYQVCSKCGAERLYNFASMTAGTLVAQKLNCNEQK